MALHDKRYWVIEITKGFELVFRKRLAGNLSDKEVSTILQRLACKALSPGEVIAASVRRPNHLLKVRVDRSPDYRRAMIWMPALPDFRASYWKQNELFEYPEILPDQ